MTRTALLLALACSSYDAHAPDLGDALDGDACGRVPVAEYSAAGGCIRLADTNGKTLFKLSTSESCGGPPCIVVHPGETAYALAKLKPGQAPEWSVETVACDEQCCGLYLGEEQCW